MRTCILFILLHISSMAIAITTPITHLIGQFNEKEDTQFISLDNTVLPVNKPNMYLQKEVVEQLQKAYKDFTIAHPDIPFIIVSATRNYNYQNQIWQRKWNNLYPKFKDSSKTADEILHFSSMPGSSRHHWGTDFDITSVEPNFFQKTTKGKVLYQWLKNNMPKYGFCQPYNEGRNGGFQPEQWHWSYKPISIKYMLEYQKILDETPEAIISRLNFSGHSEIDLIKLLREYVLTVSKDCY